MLDRSWSGDVSSGGSVGIAVFTVILQRHLDGAGSAPDAQAAAFGTAYAWVLATAVIATLPGVLLAVTERRARTGSTGARA